MNSSRAPKRTPPPMKIMFELDQHGTIYVLEVSPSEYKWTQFENNYVIDIGTLVIPFQFAKQ
jgi:hypothetical protein